MNSYRLLIVNRFLRLICFLALSAMLIVHLFLAHIGYSTTQPAARFAGFLKEKLKQIHIGRLAEWSKAKKSNPPQGDIWKSGTSQVRILHLPQNSMTIQTSLLGTQKRRGATALNQYIAGREATDEGPHVSENVIRPGGRSRREVRVRCRT